MTIKANIQVILFQMGSVDAEAQETWLLCPNFSMCNWKLQIYFLNCPSSPPHNAQDTASVLGPVTCPRLSVLLYWYWFCVCVSDPVNIVWLIGTPTILYAVLSSSQVSHQTDMWPSNLQSLCHISLRPWTLTVSALYTTSFMVNSRLTANWVHAHMMHPLIDTETKQKHQWNLREMFSFQKEKNRW